MYTEQTMMSAVVCDGTGEPQVMHIKQVPMPLPWAQGPAQVLIRVRAAGVNRPDVLQRSGLYAPPADASPYLGLEVAGEVVAMHGEVGSGVTIQVGDWVCALTHGGGYAEFVWVDARHCLPVPKGWSLTEAATLPETFFTVWLNVFEGAHLGSAQRGAKTNRQETLLIHAGASGIGVAAIQMAKALGHRVVVTLRQLSKEQRCRDLGADEVVLLDENWPENVLTYTQGKGVNVVLDMLGAATAEGNMQVLAQGGRIAWIAFLTGSKMTLKVHEVMGKQAQLSGAFLRPQTPEVKAHVAQQLHEHIVPHLESARIVSVIDRVFKMQDVVQAHEYMASNQHTGKIVLEW